MNIQGLLAHFAELDDMVVKRSPLVVYITESHITKDIEETEFCIKGYSAIVCYSNSRHTGGTLLYIRKGYKFKVVFNDSVDYSFWSLGVTLQIKKEDLLVGAIYRSPSGSSHDFLEYLEEQLNNDVLGQRKVVLMGDLNIDFLVNDRDSRKLKRIIHSAGFKQIVTKATRITERSATLIDHIITNVFTLVEIPRNFPKISDHDIIGVNIKIEDKKQTSKNTFTRNLSEQNIQNIVGDLIGEAWNYTSTDVDVVYYDFIKILQKTFDKWASPKKNEENYEHRWITRIVRDAQHARDEAYRRYQFTRVDADWHDYKIKRNRVTSVMRKEKTKYYQQNIENCRGNGKKMWKTLKELVGNKKQCADFTNIDFGQYNGGVEENMNNFYADSLNEISESIEKMQWNPAFSVNECNLLTFKEITISELRKIVYSFKNKSTSDSLLSVELVKKLFGVIGYPLLYIINTSITTGRFPSELKTSVIVPIPKVSNPSVPADFRPINLLPVIDKIIETIICNQLRTYFETNCLLYDGQSGFRNKHSCESALQYTCAAWRKNMSESRITLSVFVDLKRAFETIDRDILISKLGLYGIRGNALNWIKNFLDNRYHQTKVEGVESGKRHSVWGVPQGSVLGPLLFIIYINDIYMKLTNSFVNLFADDTLISVSGQNFEQLTTRLNDELKTLYVWLCENKLKLNSAKTKCMVIGSRANCQKYLNLNLALNINGENVQFVNEIKYLGVILDPQLGFGNHVDYMCKKIGKKIGFLKRVSGCLSSWTKLLVYNTIIFPHFSYASSLLIACTNEDVHRLQILQNKIMRILLNCDRYTPIVCMLDRLNWLNVRQFIRGANLLLIYKIENDLQPEYLKFNLKKRSNYHGYNIRNSQHYNISLVTKTALQKTLFYDGLRYYNELPNDIKNAPSLRLFKSRLFLYLRN